MLPPHALKARCETRSDALTPAAHIGRRSSTTILVCCAQVIRKLALDTYGCIALVNFIRASMAAPGSDAAAVAKAVNDCDTSLRQAFPWRDDKYMQPVLEDDPLLYSLAAGVEDDDDDQDPAEGGRLISAKSGSEDSGSEQMNAMMAEMRAMQAQMAGILGDFVGGDETNAPLGRGERESTGVEAAAKTPTSGLALLGSPVGPSGKRVDAADDSSYFASYGRLGIHEEMLADHVSPIPRNPMIPQAARHGRTQLPSIPLLFLCGPTSANPPSLRMSSRIGSIRFVPMVIVRRSRATGPSFATKWSWMLDAVLGSCRCLRLVLVLDGCWASTLRTS